jgi:hypothetical protein
VTTERTTKVWWCRRTISYALLKQTCKAQLGSVCVVWSARQVKARPLILIQVKAEKQRERRDVPDESNKALRAVSSALCMLLPY